jgi:hypothetical protein
VTGIEQPSRVKSGSTLQTINFFKDHVKKALFKAIKLNKLKITTFQRVSSCLIVRMFEIGNPRLGSMKHICSFLLEFLKNY